MRIVNTISVKLDCLKYFTLLQSNKTIQAVFHYYHLDPCLMHFTVPKREDNSSELFQHLLLQLVTRYNLHPVLHWVMLSLFFEVSAPFSFMNCIHMTTRMKKAGSEYRRIMETCATPHQIHMNFNFFSSEDWCLL